MRDAVAKEETAGFNGGTDERGADSTVETADSFFPQGLSEAVQRAGIAEWKAIGLRLESDFDSVERVFDDFTDTASDLDRCELGLSRTNVILTEPHITSFNASLPCAPESSAILGDSKGTFSLTKGVVR